jgi:hypothetical protein
MIRKHVRVLPHRNAVPTKFHSDGQNADYFLIILRTVLISLVSSEPPTLHQNLGAALWELIPLTCTCCNL